jgi:Raf kinase inhibitor-like YbhB/YbcL family protein
MSASQTKWLVAAILVGIAGGLLLYALSQRDNTVEDKVKSNVQELKQTSIIESKTMQLSSNDFKNNGLIPSEFTCDGPDVNPSLSISGVPEGAQSLVLIMDDPDVPKEIREDGMWDHWVVFNIPPDTSAIERGVEPAGVHGQGTSGDKEYHGPCPPDREHRYFFKLYALDTVLALGEGASKQEVEREMEGHVIGQAELMGRYSRKVTP